MDSNVSKRGKRAYVGTKNNPTEEDYERAKAFGENHCTYFCCGTEIGTECHTPHLQMYMEFKDTKSFSAVHKLLFPCWLAGRKGPPKTAAGYCKKGTVTKFMLGTKFENDDWANLFPRTCEDPGMFFPDDPWDEPLEFGEISEQGHRTDIDEVVALVMEGHKMKHVAKQFPAQFVKYHRGLEALKAVLVEPRDLPEMPHVIWRWGSTGTGKTETAYQDFEGIPHYVFGAANGGWWNQYDGQDKIILDEFRGQMDMPQLLGLLDKREFMAPYKGGFVQIRASKFVITSPYPPNKVYGGSEYDRIDQLLRRITTIVHHEPRSCRLLLPTTSV